jgi:Ca2+-binding RTX toxin-like protein
MGRGSRGAVLIAWSVAALCTWSTSANAATAEVRHRVVEGNRYEGDSHYADITYRAAPGEANRLDVTRIRHTVTFHDPGARIEPGTGCHTVAPHEVACRGRSGYQPNPLIHVGDGDDRVTLSAATGQYWWVHAGDGADVVTVGGSTAVVGGGGEDRSAGRLYGGSGDDVLRGGRTADDLRGGAGADVLEGRDGDDELTGDGDHPSADVLDGGAGDGDTVSYVDRTLGVTVDLERERGNGAPGEGDRIRGVENAAGGSASDRLLGSDGRNSLYGDYPALCGCLADGGSVAEHDVLVGRGGNDDITGSAGADRVLGGPGRDYLYGGETGDDFLSGGPGGDQLTGSSGFVRYDAGGGNDSIEPDDLGRGSDIACGRGAGDDVYPTTANDRLHEDCEVTQIGDVFVYTRLVRRSGSALELRIRTFDTPLPYGVAVVKLRGPFGEAGERPRFLGKGEVRMVRKQTRTMSIRLTKPGKRLLAHDGPRTVPVRLTLLGRRYDRDGPLRP